MISADIPPEEVVFQYWIVLYLNRKYLHKSAHARDFHNLFLHLFFQSLIDTKRSTVNIFKNILQILTDI